LIKFVGSLWCCNKLISSGLLELAAITERMRIIKSLHYTIMYYIMLKVI